MSSQAPHQTAFSDFIQRLTLLIKKHPGLVTTTLSNIFTMRLIGNKTHGDLAEIGMAEFVNQYMYDFRSVHVGKDLYRAKSREEDITVINEITKAEFPVSLKAYGDGPLQLSTDKTSGMFARLQQEEDEITDVSLIKVLLEDTAFKTFDDINVLPLIYDEKKQRCNIMIFDYAYAKRSVVRVSKVVEGNGRDHPVYRFFDESDGYICEVRYGDAKANALQRGLWTHTKNAQPYFYSVTGGWVTYAHNHVLVELFSHALVSTENGHRLALDALKKDIKTIKQSEELP